MTTFVGRHGFFGLEIAVAFIYFVVFVGREAEQGGGAAGVFPLLLAAGSIAFHRVRPGLAMTLVAVETCSVLAFGFGHRTPTLEMWASLPLVLFSAAFFGGRLAMVLSVALGPIVWMVLTLQAGMSALSGQWAGVPPLDWLAYDAPNLMWTASALVLPPLLGAFVRTRIGARPWREESVERPAETLESFASDAGLSRRELRVFELAAIGLSNAEIAAAEHVSEATVKSQMTRVLAKTGARDRVQLAIIAHSRRLVQPHMTGRGLD